MYQAVPVFIDEPDQTSSFQKDVFVAQPKLFNLTSEKVSMERKEFLESMLKTSSEQSNVVTGHQNGIENVSQQKIGEKDEEEKRLKQEMRKRAHEKHLEDQKIKEEVFSEKLKDEEKGKEKEKERENLFTKDFTKKPQLEVSIEGQVGSSKNEINFETKIQVQKAEIKSVHDTIQTREAKLNEPRRFPQKDLSENAAEVRGRYCLSQTPTLRPKLYPFEAPQKESGFSISGMWSNVNLGLVKERSTFWQKCDRKNRRWKNSQNRKSRVIDPNEWVGHPTIISNDKNEFPEPQPLRDLPKNKFLSSGNLVADAEAEEVVSSAMVAIEKRSDGRKSADIFVPSNYNHKMSQVNKQREEKIKAQKIEQEVEKEAEKSKQGQRVLDEVLAAESLIEGFPMEEVLKQELEKQKLIEQKLREIEEQNRILAELEAKENRLRKEEEERKRMFEEAEMLKQKEIEKEKETLKKQESESQIVKQNQKETLKKQESEMLKQKETESQILKVKETEETLRQITESTQSTHSTKFTEEDFQEQLKTSEVTKDDKTDEVEHQQKIKVEDKHPPQVPGRTSSKLIVRERSFGKMNSPQPMNSHLLVSVSPAPSSTRLSSSPSLEMLSPNIVQVRKFG